MKNKIINQNETIKRVQRSNPISIIKSPYSKQTIKQRLFKFYLVHGFIKGFLYNQGNSKNYIKNLSLRKSNANLDFLQKDGAGEEIYIIQGNIETNEHNENYENEENQDNGDHMVESDNEKSKKDEGGAMGFTWKSNQKNNNNDSDDDVKNNNKINSNHQFIGQHRKKEIQDEDLLKNEEIEPKQHNNDQDCSPITQSNSFSSNVLAFGNMLLKGFSFSEKTGNNNNNKNNNYINTNNNINNNIIDNNDSINNYNNNSNNNNNTYDNNNNDKNNNNNNDNNYNNNYNNNNNNEKNNNDCNINNTNNYVDNEKLYEKNEESKDQQRNTDIKSDTVTTTISATTTSTTSDDSNMIDKSNSNSANESVISSLDDSIIENIEDTISSYSPSLSSTDESISF
ncbi:hypothetical protein ACTFIU_002207 [Dictyostelium citrinum]